MTAKRTPFGWQLHTEHGHFFGPSIRSVEYQALKAQREVEYRRAKYESHRQMVLDEQRNALQEQYRA